MKMHLLALVGLVISFALPTFAQQTNTPDPQLRQKLVDVIAKHADAMNKDDAAAAAACFTQDGVYVTDRGPINGREAIEKWYADLFQRVKFPPNFKVPPHTHPYSEVVTVLSGTYWNAMGDDTEKGVMLKPGSVFVLPANHTHRVWTTDEEVIIQINFTGPGGINFINPADDPRNK
jgi:mannose-6-phosphate isomerase-like protein (cupin superfamily)